MMKFTLIFLLTFSVTALCGQSREYIFDYVVDYTIPNQKEQKLDSITVAYDIQGKHLWSNADFLAKSFGQSFIASSPDLMNSAISNIIFELETGEFIVGLESESIAMMLRMSAKQLMGQDQQIALSEMGLTISPTGDKREVLGNEHSIYELIPNNNPENSLLMVIDESKNVNSGAIFQYIVQLVAGRELTEPVAQDLPRGLILSVQQNGIELLTAYKVSDEKKIIKYDYYLAEKR